MADLPPDYGALTPEELGVAALPHAPTAPMPGMPVAQTHGSQIARYIAIATALATHQPGLLAGVLHGQDAMEQDRLAREQQARQEYDRQQAAFVRQEQAQQADMERRRALYGANIPKLKAQIDKASSQEDYDAAIHAWAQGLQSQSLRVTPQRLMQDVGPWKGIASVADAALDDYEKKPAIQQTFQQNPEALWNATIKVGGRDMTYRDAWKLSGRPVDAQGNPVMTPAGSPGTQDDVLLDGKPAKVVIDTRNKKVYDLGGQEITNAATRVRPIPKAAPTGTPTTDTDAIADAIFRGEQPPTLQGLYRQGAAVRVALAKRGFNLSNAQTDWNATQKHLATLNGSQQTRLHQAIETASSSLDVIENLAGEWKGSGFPILNRANLALARNGVFGEQAASIATQLEGQITDVVSELGNVYMGGNSPTDHALKLAQQNLNGAWSEKVLRDMIGLARTNLQIRGNSIKHSGVIGASATNPYAATPPPATSPPTAPTAWSGPPIGERRLFNGQLGEWDGKGWKPVR